MDRIVLEVVNLFCTGIFAGMEFIVCFGVRAPLNVLDEQPHIQVRQAVIRRLRVLVPAAFVPRPYQWLGWRLWKAPLPARFAGVRECLPWSSGPWPHSTAPSPLTWPCSPGGPTPHPRIGRG